LLIKKEKVICGAKASCCSGAITFGDMKEDRAKERG